jgi:hypothetical protein
MKAIPPAEFQNRQRRKKRTIRVGPDEGYIQALLALVILKQS